MGTNYYVRVDLCDACGRSEELHVSKNLTMFQARMRWEDGDEKIDLASWAEWRRFIRQHDLVVYDEYGGAIQPEAFIEMVEDTDKARRRRQFDWFVENQPTRASHAGPVLGMEWLDPDGFSFSTSEFS